MMFYLNAASWADMTKAQQKQYKSLINKGGEVNSAHLDLLLERASKLAFATDDTDSIRATAALKIPNKSYRRKVFKNAELSDREEDFKYELGWIFAAKSARGHKLGKRLSQLLLRSVTFSVYATSANDIDHHHVHSMLQRLGFSKEGASYKGSSGRMISLFLREGDA